MDTKWERATPLNNISLVDISNIFKLWDENIIIINFNPVNIGCINSNFIINTNKDDYLLRILPKTDHWQYEKNVYTIVFDKINVPKLLFSCTYENRNIIIYEYIESKSLQNVLEKSPCNKKNIIEQVAKTAAKIHNLGIEKTTNLINFDVPPFEMWYKYFIENENARKRLGNTITEKIEILIDKNKALLKEIDKYNSLIHSDFRPANMIIDDNDIIYIVDWDNATKGHVLADIGQFFRYSNLFNAGDIVDFEITYNKFADMKIPKDWYKLSKLRDLVNPLQMLGSDNDKPIMYTDLKNIVIDTLNYFCL